MIKELLIKVPLWSDLTRLGKNKVITSSYIWLIIVPIVAKALSKIEEITTITAFNTTWKITTRLPFNWENLYYGALSFTIANIIYSIYCHYSIKEYKTFQDYQQNGKNNEQMITAFLHVLKSKFRCWPLIKPEEVSKKFLLEYTDFKNEDSTQKDIIEMLLKHNIKEEKLKDAYSFTYLIFNASYLIPRIACTIFYATGFLLLAVVLYHNTLFVISS